MREITQAFIRLDMENVSVEALSQSPGSWFNQLRSALRLLVATLAIGVAQQAAHSEYCYFVLTTVRSLYYHNLVLTRLIMRCMASWSKVQGHLFRAQGFELGSILSDAFSNIASHKCRPCFWGHE